MSLGVVDFKAVQWARKMETQLQGLLSLNATDMAKVAALLTALAKLNAEEVTLTSAQMTVILQNLASKNLDKLEAVKGGLMVYFNGDGFEFEQFLLKEDGRVPNHKYLSKRVS